MAETEEHASLTVSRSMANNAGPSFIDSKLAGMLPLRRVCFTAFESVLVFQMSILWQKLYL